MNETKTYNIRNVSFIIFVVFCIQFTELKVGVIKVAEILLLLLTPFIFYRKVNKWILLFIILFTSWFLVSILLNPFREFYPLSNVSALKRPYLISLGRFLELISCVNLTALVHNFFKKKTRQEMMLIIKQIYILSFIILSLFILIYFLFTVGFISENRFVYERIPRLRGWYAEGGPYGLMLSFTFCLSYFFKYKYNAIFRVIIVLAIIFLAKSKAGILLIIAWFTLLYYKRLYRKIRSLNIIVIVIGGLIASVVFVKLADTYIVSIQNVRKEMVERPEDINLIMGRIAGLYIFPDMLMEHPFFGIGLGNYPIMRNNPAYLDFVPPSPPGKTDAHGFGGIIQILVDGGIVMLFSFFTIIYFFLKRLKNQDHTLKIYLYIFLGLFAFGVQIYFLYPWVLFGILITLSNKPKRV